MVTSALSTGMAGFGTDTFMKLFVAQLSNQDPMEPMSNYEFTSQLAQMGQLEAITGMKESFDALMQVQEFSSASALIGKQVTYLPAGSSITTTGEVTGVRLVDGAVRLVVGGELVALESVIEVGPGGSA